MQQQLPFGSNGVELTLAELLEYKNHSLKWLPPARSLWSQMSGGHQSRRTGRGMNFSEVRRYQAGDDIRAIDWRVTARTGKPHTKLFSEEREQPVMLYIDISPGMRFGSSLMLKSVQAAHLAALISWLTTASQDRIGALIDDGCQLTELKPTARAKGTLHLLDQLVSLHNAALHHPESATLPVSQALKALHRLCPKGSDIILISDFQRFDKNDAAQLRQLRQHNRLRVISVYDPLEQGQTPFKGQARVSDGEQGQWLNFGSRALRQAFASQWKTGQTHIKTTCDQLAIPVHFLSGGIPLLPQLAQIHTQEDPLGNR